jgi:hypothetical protein
MKLYSVFDEPTKTSMVLELILGGNMQTRMAVNGCPFSESTASLIIGDILSALRCLHRWTGPRHSVPIQILSNSFRIPRIHAHSRQAARAPYRVLRPLDVYACACVRACVLACVRACACKFGRLTKRLAWLTSLCARVRAILCVLWPWAGWGAGTGGRRQHAHHPPGPEARWVVDSDRSVSQIP